ncbi:MAG: chorismate-binding protein [Candidatus Bathyarchaeota archaeon]|nr:MAG: chorismate-binding protein [Candidatus Bathyarchaeota archaeon]
MAECPKCGAEAEPVKTWKMAGRPSRTGEKLQLTIGFYKCDNCKKPFRKAIKKEKIKVTS